MAKKLTPTNASVRDVMLLLDITKNMEEIQNTFRLSGSTTDIEARKNTAVPTGLLMFDLLLGGGIFPGGWYTIIGGEGGGKCLAGETLVPTNKGLLTLEEIYKRSEIKTFNGFNKLKGVKVKSHVGAVRKATDVYISRGAIREIIFKDGGEMAGLGTHKLWALKDGKMQFVKMSDIEEGTWLPKSLGSNLFPNKEPLLRIDPDMLAVKHRKLCDAIVPKRMSPELASILGLVVSEGSANNDSITQNPGEVASYFIRLMNTVFGVNCSVTKNIRLNIPKSAWFTIHQIIGGSEKSADRKVPKLVRMGTKETQVAFLRALFEGDGTVGDRNVTLTSISKQLVLEVKAMLDNLGIYCYVRSRESFATNGSDKQVPVTSYFVTCTCEDFAKIGFISSKKQHKMEYIIENTRNLNISNGFSSVIPFINEAKKVVSILRNNGIQVRFVKDLMSGKVKSLTYVTAKRLLSQVAIANIEDPELAELVSTLEYGINNTWTQVLEVRNERKVRRTDLVYDLNVEIDHSYQVGGVLTHNSTLMMAIAVALYGSGVPYIDYRDPEGCVTEDNYTRVNGEIVYLHEIINSVLTNEQRQDLYDKWHDSHVILPIPIKVDTVDKKNVDAFLTYGGFNPITELTLINNETITGYKHPIAVLEGVDVSLKGEIPQPNKYTFKNIEDIEVGDYVHTKEFGVLEVIESELLEEPEHVWDLSVLGTDGHPQPHTIYINDIITHNSTSPEYIEKIASVLTTSDDEEFDIKRMFGIKDGKGEWVIQPRIFLTNENSLEDFYKSVGAMLKRLPDKIYINGEWWLLFDNTKENISKFKGMHDTKMSKKYKKICIKALDGGTAQALILLDSIPMLISDKDADSDDGDDSIGLSARGHSKHLPKVRGRLKRKHATVVAINQLRADVSAAVRGQAGKEYEPAGYAVRYAADVRVKATQRTIPHGKGMVEKETSVLRDGAEDTYRYIHLNGFKNKFGTPYISVWTRLWVADHYGKARGYDPVFDVYTYLCETGQALNKKGEKLNGVVLSEFYIKMHGEEALPKMKFLDLKALILLKGKKLKNYCEALGIKKNPKIHEKCRAQIKSGLGVELFFNTMAGEYGEFTGGDDDESLDVTQMEDKDLINLGYDLDCGTKKELKKLKRKKLEEVVQEALDAAAGDDEDEEEE